MQTRCFFIECEVVVFGKSKDRPRIKDSLTDEELAIKKNFKTSGIIIPVVYLILATIFVGQIYYGQKIPSNLIATTGVISTVEIRGRDLLKLSFDTGAIVFTCGLYIQAGSECLRKKKIKAEDQKAVAYWFKLKNPTGPDLNKLVALVVEGQEIISLNETQARNERMLASALSIFGFNGLLVILLSVYLLSWKPSPKS